MDIVCSSCFEAYINVGYGLSTSMIKDLITWFYQLDKPSRKLVVDSFSDPDFIRALEIKDKVERETQEQKRRDLLQ